MYTLKKITALETYPIRHAILRKGEPIEGGKLIKRPDIVVDVLHYINALPRDRVVKVTGDQGTFTVLRELIRVGVKPEEAYSQCEDDQLCPVK